MPCARCWHRGAVDADGKTGDGAGIYLEIPQSFFREQLHSDKDVGGRLAVGMVFLPRTDFAAQERCRTIVETEILGFGYAILGWRQVPVDTSVIGEKAIATRPEIEQIIVGNAKGVSDDDFERELFLIRRRIEKQVLAEHINGFYICSLSCRAIIYKGLFLAEQLSVFYPDLLDARFVSSFAIFHQRYSTNTWPSWPLAQPFRMLAHNGEINTLRGNLNWMKSHETRMVAPAFGEHNEDVKPIVQAGSSDSAALDAVLEALVRAGRSLPLVKTLLIPPAWARKMAIPQAHKDLFSYCNCVMEPWDGPAAVVACDGHWVIGGMDRNGLRPMRYTRTDDDLLVVGSETGMVPLPSGSIIEQGRVGPGEMIAVDLRAGVFYRDRELKDLLAGEKPYGQWVQNITHLDDLVGRRPHGPVQMERAELRRRQNLFGISHEDLELLLAPMVLDAKEAVGSMGDDTPIAVLSSRYRGLHHFFRQQFSQVTNPPIDSLREYRVMSLKTRYGNLGNVYDEAPSQTQILQLESPLLLTPEFQTFLEYFGPKATILDCTFEVDAGPRGAARGARPHPRAGGGRGARGLRADRAERRRGVGDARAHADDPGGRCGALAPRAPGPAQLQLDHRALRRVSGRALRGRPDRRRRHGGQSLPRGGRDRRAPRARPVSRVHPGGMPQALQGGGRSGPAEDHLQDGHLDPQQLSRRLQLRGDRAVALAVRRVLPGAEHAALRHRAHRHSEEGAGAARARLCRGQPAAADRRSVPLSPRRGAARAGRPGDLPAAIRGLDRFLCRLQEVHRDGVPRRADRDPRPAGLRRYRHDAGAARRGGVRSPRSESASSRRGCRSGRWARRRTRP